MVLAGPLAQFRLGLFLPILRRCRCGRSSARGLIPAGAYVFYCLNLTQKGTPMATLRQTCEALDDILYLPASSARGHAQRLRGVGMLPANQGLPTQISSEHIAKIVLAIAVGSPLVADYLALRPGSGGPTFGTILAGFIDHPNELLELTIDSLAPGASVTFRGVDHGVQTVAFYPATPSPRPSFDRHVRFGPDIFIKLAASIANAPEVRAGRPRLIDRYRRKT